MAFAFLHAADLHLDCQFEGISKAPNDISNTLREATFAAWRSVVKSAIEHGVEFVLIAGDVFNSKDRSLRAQIRYRDGLNELANYGIETFVVHGNHDPAGSWNASIDWPDLVHTFTHERIETIPVIRKGCKIAAITGISYAQRDVRENLAAKFHAEDTETFNIGLLHCTCGASSEHEPYAPCSVSDLSDKGFDYWALGHVHTRSIISSRSPVIAYPGNTQGLNPNETGARGCLLVSVDDLKKVDLKFIDTDAVRWFQEAISIDEMTRDQDILDAIQSKIEEIRTKAHRPSVVRISLTGRGVLHKSLVRQSFINHLLDEIRIKEARREDFVWVESISDATAAEIDIKERRKGQDFVGDFLRVTEEAKQNTNSIRELLEPLFEHKEARSFIQAPSNERIIEWIERAETMVLDELAAEESI